MARGVPTAPPVAAPAPELIACACGDVALVVHTRDGELLVLEPDEVVPRMRCPECEMWGNRRRRCDRCQGERWIGDTLPKPDEGVWLAESGWARRLPGSWTPKGRRSGTLKRPHGHAAHRLHRCAQVDATV